MELNVLSKRPITVYERPEYEKSSSRGKLNLPKCLWTCRARAIFHATAVIFRLFSRIRVVRARIGARPYTRQQIVAVTTGAHGLHARREIKFTEAQLKFLFRRRRRKGALKLRWLPKVLAFVPTRAEGWVGEGEDRRKQRSIGTVLPSHRPFVQPIRQEYQCLDTDNT